MSTQHYGDDVSVCRMKWSSAAAPPTRTALAAAMMLALGLAAPAHATNFMVRSAADSGPLTLRQAILDANASVGPHLIYFVLPPDSTISLSSGDLELTGPDVTVQGPGRDQLTISGSHNSRIFHVVTGSLTLNDVTLRDGLALGDDTNESDQRGGAILVGTPLTPPSIEAPQPKHRHVLDAQSLPTVPTGTPLPALNLSNVAIYASQAMSPTDGGGGAVFSQTGALTIDRCVMDGNFARRNGGALAMRYGTILITDSTFTNNTVDFSSRENQAAGGGILINRSSGSVARAIVRGNHLTDVDGLAGASGGSGIGAGFAMFMQMEDFRIEDSEFSDNQSTEIPLSFGGGMQCHLELDNTAPTLTLVNSTISGNVGLTGGVEAGCNLAILNSTIANNTSTNVYGDGGAPGIEAYSPNTTEQIQLTITSSLISGNLGGGENLRIYHADGYADPAFVGANALIQSVETGLALPPDTIIGVDPRLAALTNNGGPTRTQALLPGSIAIDAGANLQSLAFDQRGTGFTRVISVAADIGAFEFDSDRIFSGDFE